MQNGTYKNATPPFGFKKVNGNLEIEENQASIVRQIFEWYISGYGLKAIADKLNAMNLPGSKQAVLWKADNIRYMLKNDRYIGNAMFQKSYVTETLPYIKKRNYGEKQKYCVTGVNQQIVDKETFYAAQKLLESRHRDFETNVYPLSKKVFCGKCGATYKFKKYGDKHYWTCRTHDKKSELCENGRIAENNISETCIGLRKRKHTGKQNLFGFYPFV